MVPGDSALGEGDPAMAEAGSHERDVIGATVMTDAGAALGTVVDVVLEVGDDARVVGFEVHGRGLKEGAP